MSLYRRIYDLFYYDEPALEPVDAEEERRWRNIDQTVAIGLNVSHRRQTGRTSWDFILWDREQEYWMGWRRVEDEDGDGL